MRWSTELFRIYGLDPDTFGASFEAYLERVHPEDRVRVQATISAALEAGEDYHFEERIVQPQGAVRELESVGRVLRDAAGAPLKLVGACMDVTERNRKARRQREHEEQLALALEAARMGSWRWDATEGTVFWTPEVERIFGAEPGTFPGTTTAFMERLPRALVRPT